MEFQMNDKIDDKVLKLAFPNEYSNLNSNKPKSVYQLGPLISIYNLSNDVFNKMNLIVGDTLASKDKVRYGHHLAGQIDSEYLIPKDVMKDADLVLYFENIMKCYLRDYYNSLKSINPLVHTVQSNIKINEFWIVEQFKYEYNPLHWHENCTLSAVMYLKVPKMTNKKNIPGKRNKAGNITLVNSSSNPNQSFESPFLTVLPKEKELYIFPGHLAHTVYPFDNDVRRLSVSFNATHITKGIPNG